MVKCKNCEKEISIEESWIPVEFYHLHEKSPTFYCHECALFFNGAFHADLKSTPPRYFERRK